MKPREEQVKYIRQSEFKSRLGLLKQNTRISHIEERDRIFIEKIITSYHDIFTLPADPLPCTNLASHKIILKDERAINIRQYRHPECHKEEISTQINDMLTKTVISPSDSPYNAPLWVVPKKKNASGKVKWKIVIDFRKLKEKSDQDAYPLPVIDEILDYLGNAKFFSAFDLSSGFHQIPMDENSKKYTAFSTPE